MVTFELRCKSPVLGDQDHVREGCVIGYESSDAGRRLVFIALVVITERFPTSLYEDSNGLLGQKIINLHFHYSLGKFISPC